MKIIAIIILYFPDIDEIVKNIGSFIDGVEELVVWDNTPKEERYSLDRLYQMNETKITFMNSDKNEGLAFPINEVIKYARSKSYTHLLTMDQDTEFINFDAYIKLVNENNNPYIKIFSPQITTKPATNSVSVIDFTIQSGSIYEMSIFEYIGLFRQDFFIDQIDVEFGYRAKKNNFLSVVVNNCLINHEIGHSKGGRIILGFLHVTSDNYPAFRRYYLIRNSIIVMRTYNEYCTRNAVLFFIRKRIFRQIGKIAISENNKWIKIISIFKGMKDGMMYNINENDYGSNYGF